METQSFVDLIKNYNNPNTYTAKSNPSIEAMYPYGQFPIEKTKGYDPFEHLKKKESSNVKIETLSEKPPALPKSDSFLSGLDMKMLLPIIANMKNKSKFSTYDLFNLLVPTLTKNNPDLKDIIEYFTISPEPAKKHTLQPSKMQSIDSYVKA